MQPFSYNFKSAAGSFFSNPPLKGFLKMVHHFSYGNSRRGCRRLFFWSTSFFGIVVRPRQLTPQVFLQHNNQPLWRCSSSWTPLQVTPQVFWNALSFFLSECIHFLSECPLFSPDAAICNVNACAASPAGRLIGFLLTLGGRLIGFLTAQRNNQLM